MYKSTIKAIFIKRLKKILFDRVASYKYFQEKLHCFIIKLDQRIQISQTARLKITTKVEVRFGGRIEVGANTELLDNVCLFTYGGKIKIGNNCSINPFAVIYGHGGTTIGNNVLIAGHCMIIPSNHNFKDLQLPILEQGNTSYGIFIDDDVWIAHGCSILDNVTIGKGAIVAAGSVVNKDIPPFTVYGGVPAKFIKHRFE